MKTFDRGFARLLLEICRYAYAAGQDTEDRKDALNRIRKAGGLLADEPVILQGSETSVACIASYSDRNIVSYISRKNQFDTLDTAMISIKNWSDHFKTLLTPFKLNNEQLGTNHLQNLDKDNLGGLVHCDFLEELASVQDKVVIELLRNGGRSKPTYITGYSQGGAEAILATRALLAGGFSVVSAYTFAAPRPGNLEFARSLPDTLPIHRIEYGNDVVPHIPPAAMNKKIKELINKFEFLQLNKQVKALLILSQQATHIENSFVSIGMLCYGCSKTKTLRIDIPIAQEKILFDKRLEELFKITHLKDWIEHHHLVNAVGNQEGDYTTLISDFPIE